MTIFTAKVQRSKEAKKQGEVSFLCLFAPLHLCSKKFHHQFDHYIFAVKSLVSPVKKPFQPQTYPTVCCLSSAVY